MKRLLPFLKNLSNNLKHIKETVIQSAVCTSINLYAMDESRFGQMTIQRRCITVKGVKPILPYQHQFENFYLFGAYSPIDGDHYTLEFPYCNSECFQLYLDNMAKHRPHEFKILILDNGAFHKAQQLYIPSNIELLFFAP